MVAGLEVAMVLRSKQGPTLMVQTRGVDVKAAVSASAEVVDLLASHASKQYDDDGSGDNPPGYASGDMPACNDRFRVVYRLVGQVYVMAVAPGAMNVFFSTQLVNAAVHRLCALSRGGGAALNQERLTSRFPEVYLAVAALLANGGQAKAAKLVARANVDSISSDATKSYKHLKRGVARGVANPLDMLRGRTHKAAEPQAAPLFVAPRSLAEEVDPLTVASFALPPDALPPLRYVEAEKPSAAPAVGWDMAGYRLVPLSPTASQVAAEEAKMGEMGELGPQEPKNGEMWTKMRDKDAPRPNAGNIDDVLPDTPTGPKGLWLEELWRCHFVGGEMKMAGTLGTVLGTAPLTSDHLKTSFRLKAAEGASTALQKFIIAARHDPAITVQSDDWYESGFHVAAFDSTFGIERPVFLRYELPAIVLQPPIQVRFMALLSEPAEGKRRRRLTMLLRYIVRPAAEAIPLYAVCVDLDVHPHLGRPLRVDPAATWGRKQHRLQWRLPMLEPGQRGDLKAYFEPDAAKDPAPDGLGHFGGYTAAAIEEAVLRMQFTGPPRQVATGTVLEAGLTADSVQPVPEQAFFGNLSAQAELVKMPKPWPRLPSPPPTPPQSPPAPDKAADAVEQPGTEEAAPPSSPPASPAAAAPPPPAPLPEDLFSEPPPPAAPPSDAAPLPSDTAPAPPSMSSAAGSQPGTPAAAPEPQQGESESEALASQPGTPAAAVEEAVPDHDAAGPAAAARGPADEQPHMMQL